MQGQIFKSKNIADRLQQMTLVAHSHDFGSLRFNNACDLFVTNIAPHAPFEVEAFVE